MKLTKKMLDVVQPTVVENDLLFITSVLSKIEDVVSQTYGPRAGYVARIENEDRGLGFTYTKDGMTVLNNIKFTRNSELDIARLVCNLADSIKATSGDGSTTAAKLLYHLIKSGAEEILKNKDDLRIKRINTPKAVEYIIRQLEKRLTANSDEFLSTPIMNEHIETVNDPSVREIIRQVRNPMDLVDGAFISLNNDKSLLSPFEELADYLVENKIEITDSFKVDAFRASNDKTTVETKPGYMLGTKKFIINTELDVMQNVKLIILNLSISINMIKFILIPLLDLAQSQSEGEKIVFLVNTIDEDAKVMINQVCKDYMENDVKLNFEIIESPLVYSKVNKMKVDLSYLVNTEVIMIDSTMIEVRQDIPSIVNPDGTITEGNEIDNRDTTSLVKWTADFKKDANGNIVDVDYTYGYRLFKQKYDKARKNGKLCNISRLQGSGLCLTLAEGQERTDAFNNYLNEIKQSANSEIEDVRNEAQRRLAFLNDNMYVINVAKRRYDGDRLMDAYRDATKAITSMAKYGYYMGGSVGLNIIVEEVLLDINLELGLARKELASLNDNESKDELIRKIEVLDTAVFIVNILRNGTLYLINGLLSDIFGKENYPGIDLYEEYKQAKKDGHINPFTETYGDTRVIVPVETDLVMTRTVLYQFANLFASSLIEYHDPIDTLYYTKVTNDIKENIRKELQPLVEEYKTEVIIKSPDDSTAKEVIVPETEQATNMTVNTIKQTEVTPVQVNNEPEKDSKKEELEMKRKEEIDRIIKEREEKLKLDERRRVLEALTPGPKNFTYVPDENGNIPSFVGKTYSGPSDPVERLHLDKTEAFVAIPEDDE